MKRTTKGTKQKADRLTKKYSHPEFLKEFFPNVKPDEALQEVEGVLTKEQFFDMLTRVTSIQPPLHDKERQ